MKPSSKSILLLFVLTAVFAGCKQSSDTPACRGPLGCIEIASDESIRIGVLQALSGGNAANGRSLVKTVRLAVEDRNNTLLGRPIHLQIEDSGCSAALGNASALKIAINANTAAVIGTFCSGSAAAASKIITDAGMTMISGSNSAPSLTSIDGRRASHWRPGYFRVMFNGADMARAAALFAYYELGLEKAAVIDDGSLYTSEYRMEFSKTFTQTGGKIVTTASINKGDKNMIPVITSIVLAEAQCVFFPIYQQEAGHFVRQKHLVEGAEDIVFIGGGALLTESFLEAHGQFARGMYFSSVVTPNGPSWDRLKKRYMEKYGEPPQHFSCAHTYDAANLIFSAIETVAVPLRNGVVMIDRRALRNVVYNTRNFPGVTGTLNCDRFGDCSADKFKIMRLNNPASGLEGLRSNIVYTYDPNN